MSFLRKSANSIFIKLFLFQFLFLLFSCNDKSEAVNPTDNIKQKEINALEYSEKLTQWFYDRELQTLSDLILNQDYTLKDLAEFRNKVEHQLGSERKLLNHQIIFGGNLVHYERYAKFSKSITPVQVLFTYNSKNQILNFTIKSLPPEARSSYSDYQTKTKLSLPFQGEWFVAAGGRTINLNHHVQAGDQRFAYDFLILKNLATYESDGNKNGNYFCFGKKILSPGDGIVVDIKDDIAEASPGKPDSTPGNYIIIDHGNSEYSFLAHIKKGTISVKAGENVITGQYLGLCGNSGHSTEPHLHYHLQNTPVWYKGDGLPAQFINYFADEKLISKGEPTQGQTVRNTTTK